MILQANSSQKKTGIVILISNKVDFKLEQVTGDKDGHYIIMNRTKSLTSRALYSNRREHKPTII